MHIKKFLVGSTSAFALLLGSTAAQAQNWSYLDSVMDKVAQQDQSTWIYSNSYDTGSMHGSQVVTQSSDGRLMLLRGYYTYSGGTSSTMTVRITDGQVSCISYDTSWSNCTLTGSEPGAATVITVALAAVLVAAAASSRSDGSSSSDRGYSNNGDPYRPTPTPTPDPTPPPPDTSVNCGWGDRSVGTCTTP